MAIGAMAPMTAKVSSAVTAIPRGRSERAVRMVANPVLRPPPASSPGYSLTEAPSSGQHSPEGDGDRRACSERVARTCAARRGRAAGIHPRPAGARAHAWVDRRATALARNRARPGQTRDLHPEPTWRRGGSQDALVAGADHP